MESDRNGACQCQAIYGKGELKKKKKLHPPAFPSPEKVPPSPCSSSQYRTLGLVFKIRQGSSSWCRSTVQIPMAQLPNADPLKFGHLSPQGQSSWLCYPSCFCCCTRVWALTRPHLCALNHFNVAFLIYP